MLGFIEQRFVGAKITHNAFLPGLKTGWPRQIDILVEGSVGGLDFKIAFDCKSYKRKANVKVVEAFLGMLDDVRVSKGVLVTTKGYTRGALARIQNEPRDIDLQILAPERLSDYQHVGTAILWKGEMAAFVVPPSGWVVDNEKSGKDGRPQFSIYPLGYAPEAAVRGAAFIYGNIILKSAHEPTMEAIAQRHEDDIAGKVSTAKFERLSIDPSEVTQDATGVLFRVGHISATYAGPEYSIYLDFDKGVLLLVLLCPEGQDERFVPILKEIARDALLRPCMQDVPPTE